MTCQRCGMPVKPDPEGDAHCEWCGNTVNRTVIALVDGAHDAPERTAETPNGCHASRDCFACTESDCTYSLSWEWSLRHGRPHRKKLTAEEWLEKFDRRMR